jgi:signal peptidase I
MRRRVLSGVMAAAVLGVAGIAAIGVVVLRPQSIRIEGHSMSPTLQDDDRAIFLRIRDTPARGDVVALRYPKNPAKSFVMRIVGLPGESLSIADGVVSIDGRPIPEPYLSGAGRSHEHLRQVRLAADEYFVMGDRRNNASDSREWGPVARRLIWARLHSVVWRSRD